MIRLLLFTFILLSLDSAIVFAHPFGKDREKPESSQKTKSRKEHSATVTSEISLEIDRILKTSRGAKFGVYIQDRSGAVIYEKNSNHLFKPASNLKMITSAVAIEKLSPSYRISTDFFIDGEVRDNILYGNLILAGSTDPVLSGFFDSKMNIIVKQWIDTLKHYGIYLINGEVILDNSLYIGNNYREIKDISRELKFMTVANFKRADDNQIAKVARKRFIKTKNGKVKAVRIALKSGKNLQRVDIEPNIYCANLFVKKLKESGVLISEQEEVHQVNYSFKIDRTKWRHIYSHLSEPLTEILKILNKESDNFYADQILRTLGWEYCGEASIDKGITVINSFITSVLTMGSEHFVIKDGSGLSHGNFVTPALLISLMRHMQQNSPYFLDYYDSFSIPTVDGTLSERIIHDLAKNIRAKTGSISGVISLSGYLTSRSGTDFTFSIIANGTNRKSVKRLEDRICKLLLEI